MSGGWAEPGRLVGIGVALLAGGYVALGSSELRAWWGAGRVAFYGGLVLLVAGVVIWLRRPPAPAPDESPEDEPPVEDG
jgi:hypothetical protein